MKQVQVWDWPVRLIHWSLVGLVFFSWGSAEYGKLDLHRYSGYAILGLLVFRVYWGFVGSETARFASFVKGPAAVLNYVRSPTEMFGHNPLGALSVVALLTLLAVQVTLGLFAVDVDGIESGPLSYLVSFDTGRTCAKMHGIAFDVLVWLIVLHVLAVIYYLAIKRSNLIGPMLTGRKSSDLKQPPAISTSWLKVLFGVGLSAAAIWLLV